MIIIREKKIGLPICFAANREALHKCFGFGINR